MCECVLVCILVAVSNHSHSTTSPSMTNTLLFLTVVVSGGYKSSSFLSSLTAAELHDYCERILCQMRQRLASTSLSGQLYYYKYLTRMDKSFLQTFAHLLTCLGNFRKLYFFPKWVYWVCKQEEQDEE